jgi:hypothetical protein
VIVEVEFHVPHRIFSQETIKSISSVTQSFAAVLSASCQNQELQPYCPWRSQFHDGIPAHQPGTAGQSGGKIHCISV